MRDVRVKMLKQRIYVAPNEQWYRKGFYSALSMVSITGSHRIQSSI